MMVQVGVIITTTYRLEIRPLFLLPHGMDNRKLMLEQEKLRPQQQKKLNQLKKPHQ